MANGFIGMVFGFLKEHGVDTNGMEVQDAINKYEEMNKGESVGEKETKTETPKQNNAANESIDAEVKAQAEKYKGMETHMLGRLEADVKYVLGAVKENVTKYGGTKKGSFKHLWYDGDIDKQIALMREFNNTAKKTGQGIPDSKIDSYEKQLKEFEKTLKD